METGDHATGPAQDDSAPEGPWWIVEIETRRLRDLQTAMADAESAVARRLGIGISDVSAMNHLAAASEAVGPGWLSQRLGITPAAATELVDRLERAGHLNRQRDTVDRRRVMLQPTDSALSAIGNQLQPLLRQLDAVVAEFDVDDRDVIRRFLDRVVDSYTAFARDQVAPSG
jgi:DNA-binding MarR family transcriptional regulator